MSATASQFAALAQVFNNAQATAIIDYVGAKIVPLVDSTVGQNTQITGLQVPAQISSAMRSLDTDFIVSATRVAQVQYTLELTVSQTLLGLTTASAQVDLQVNGVPVLSVESLLNATLSLGTSLTQIHRKVLVGTVPIGATVRLASTLSGTGIATLIACQEALL